MRDAGYCCWRRDVVWPVSVCRAQPWTLKKTTEPIKMPFEVTRVGTANRVLDRGAHWWSVGHKPAGHKPAGTRAHHRGVTSPPEVGQKPATWHKIAWQVGYSTKSVIIYREVYDWVNVESTKQCRLVFNRVYRSRTATLFLTLSPVARHYSVRRHCL